MKWLVVIPVFNEGPKLPLLLKELKESPIPADSVLFVDNGCFDGSEKLIAESGYNFVRQHHNMGAGAALIIGADWALAHGYDVICNMAGNAKMLPAQIDRVLSPILCGDADYVTGSRFLPGGSYPNLTLFRRSTIPLVNVYVWLLTGCWLTDATCGYRAYKTEILQRAEFDWHAPWLHGYSFEYYLYAKVLIDRSLRWKEVPVTMRYPPPGVKRSHIRPVVGWYDMLRPWAVARFDRKGFARRA